MRVPSQWNWNEVHTLLSAVTNLCYNERKFEQATQKSDDIEDVKLQSLINIQRKMGEKFYPNQVPEGSVIPGEQVLVFH